MGRPWGWYKFGSRIRVCGPLAQLDWIGHVKTQFDVTDFTPVHVSVTVQKIVVEPATDNEPYVQFVELLVAAVKVIAVPDWDHWYV